MANFRVKLGSGDGSVLSRTIHGQSAHEVTQHFQKEGYYVFSVDKAFDFSGLFGVQRRIPRAKFILFNREFRGLVKAGLPIVEGLDILLKRMKLSPLQALLIQVREQLTKGRSLSQAFQSFTGVIPNYYPALLQAGEQSGNLVEVLDRFIDQEERFRKTRKKFAQTMTYPLLLLIVGMASMFVILTRALPQFTAIYVEADKELPVITKYVVAVSSFFQSYYLHMLIGIVALTVLAVFYGRTRKGAHLRERVLRRLPIVGTLWTLQNQNIFARTLRLLLAGGVPVPQAVAISANAVPSSVFGMELRETHHALTQGESLQQALDHHTRLDDMVGEMVGVGEATGTLGDMLEYVAEHGGREVRRRPGTHFQFNCATRAACHWSGHRFDCRCHVPAHVRHL